MINELKRIESQLIDMSVRLRYERKIMQAELEDRLKKGLKGDEEIKHYNDWMKKAGLDDLMI